MWGYRCLRVVLVVVVDGCCGDCRALVAGFGGIVGFWWGIGQLEVFMGLGGDRRMLCGVTILLSWGVCLWD